MTELLVRTLSSRGGSRVRAAATVLLALATAAAAGAWLHAVDVAAGVRRGGGDPVATDAVRDAVVSLPLMLAAAWLALAVTRRVLRAARMSHEPLAGGAALTAAAGLSAAAAAALQGRLTGAAVDATGGAYDGGVLAFLGERTLVALPATALAAGAVVLLLARTRPWAATTIAARRRARLSRIAMGTAGLGAAVLASTAVLGQQVTGTASAAAGPGQPCPTGAPVRDYRVVAMNVDMPLNRFGDHDPGGKMFALTGYGDPAAPRVVGDGRAPTYVATGNVTKIQQQATSRHVSTGLRDDPIQPLVIRANLGDCVEIAFTNNASSEDVGMHIDGVAYEIGSSGDAVGRNPSSAATRGSATPTVYRYYIPDDPDLEGAKYIHPGPGLRSLVNHGLFGALVAEPRGSDWLSSYKDGTPLVSGWGWEAIIDPPGPKKAFREHVKLFHEIGNEKENPVIGPDGKNLPMKDPHTTSYRPGTRAINYRSEPFINRLDLEDRGKALAYNSYTFGDPATPMPRSYLGDPTKIRIVHAGSEMLHVYHLHGGGIRWRFNPRADTTFDYQDTGLDKHPRVVNSESQRLDSQSQAPGETYNLEIEGGAGGVQQSAGDFLYHCHIAEHYLSGMWSFWRVYDTHQADLATLPDRTALPDGVTSDALIGRTIDGQTITDAADLDRWIRPQLPTQGVPLTATPADPNRDWDADVWNWVVDTTDPARGPLYLGAPESTGTRAGAPWPNLLTDQDVHPSWATSDEPRALAGHPGVFVGDTVVPYLNPSTGVTEHRPVILFDPVNGRPAYPLLRPQIGTRAPFSPNGHSGSPWLGERGGAAPATPGRIDPWAGRADGLCPSDGIAKTFNIVSIDTRVQVTRANQADPAGKLFVLAQNKRGVLDGTKPKEPLFIRLNQGDCGFVSVVSEQPNDLEQPFSSTNVHIHHVQFDVQASDGVGTGLAFNQAVRPYKLTDTVLSSAAPAGATSITVSTTSPGNAAPGVDPALNPTEFDPAKFRPGVWIAVGEGENSIEQHQIVGTPVDNGDGTMTLTLASALASDHAAGQWAGTEFVRETWYPDVALDNIFFHDHVDGIHNWGHGLVAQLIIEPKGSTYHDPVTGAEVDSGSVVDVHTSTPLVPGVVDGSFREFAMLTLSDNELSGVGSTINLRAEPFDDRLTRNSDPSLLFSSYTHGDPYTPIPRAYAGDPFVIRTINVSPNGADVLGIDGHNFRTDTRLRDANGVPASATGSLIYGVSERFTLALGGGAGGALGQAGDYLYRNSLGRRFRQGAWGIIRVLDRRAPDLQPLPGTTVPPGPATLPAVTGGRPPDQSGNAGTPCPTGSRTRRFAVSAVNVPAGVPAPGVPVTSPISATFVPSADAAAVAAGARQPEPLVLHVAEGECVEVTLRNELTVTPGQRVSFHVAELTKSIRSSGVNIGFNPSEQTVAPGGSRLYRYYADDARIGAAAVSDLGGLDTGPTGLYGAVVVHPRGSLFRDPVSGAVRDIGTQIDVAPGTGAPYRDITVLMGDNDAEIGANTTPYNAVVNGPVLFNHRTTAQGLGQQDTSATFSSAANGGDPATGVFRANAGDRTVIHAVGTEGSEQIHAFSAGGMAWHRDMNVPHTEVVSEDRVGPGTALDADIIGGAGGMARAEGDYFVGDMRRPFTQAGLWGLLRVQNAGTSGLLPLDAPFPGPPAEPVTPAAVPAPAPTIGGLAVARRVSVRSLYAKGLRIRLTGPSDLGTLTTKLIRGRRLLVSTALTQTASPVRPRKGRVRDSLTVSPAGTVSVTWRIPPRVIAKLRPGRHTVAVVWRGQTLSAPVTITGVRAKAAAARTTAGTTVKGARRTARR